MGKSPYGVKLVLAHGTPRPHSAANASHSARAGSSAGKRSSWQRQKKSIGIRGPPKVLPRAVKGVPGIRVGIRSQHSVETQGPVQSIATKERDIPTRANKADALFSEIEHKILTQLATLDEALVKTVADGDIRLLRRSWLLDLPAGSLMPPRQQLEVDPDALLSTKHAVALISSQSREIGVLSYAWLTPHHPDINGIRLGTIQRALLELPYITAVFWECASTLLNAFLHAQPLCLLPCGLNAYPSNHGLAAGHAFARGHARPLSSSPLIELWESWPIYMLPLSTQRFYRSRRSHLSLWRRKVYCA